LAMQSGGGLGLGGGKRRDRSRCLTGPNTREAGGGEEASAGLESSDPVRRGVPSHCPSYKNAPRPWSPRQQSQSRLLLPPGRRDFLLANSPSEAKLGVPSRFSGSSRVSIGPPRRDEPFLLATSRIACCQEKAFNSTGLKFFGKSGGRQKWEELEGEQGRRVAGACITFKSHLP
jgi:hypothetical protein